LSKQEEAPHVPEPSTYDGQKNKEGERHGKGTYYFPEGGHYQGE